MYLVSLESCTLVGQLNPFILTPEWMRKEEILPPGETQMELGLGSPTPKFSSAGFVWQASADRLDVQPQRPDGNPGDLVGAILEKLHHTPVKAVGSNFHFDLAKEQVRQLAPLLESPLARHLSSLPLEAGETELSGTETKFILKSSREALVNLTILVDARGAANARFNFHRAVASTSAAATAAREWSADRNEAFDILHSIWQLAEGG